MDRGSFRPRTNPSEHDGSTGTARAVVLWGWGLALAAARRAGCNRHDDDVDLHAVAGRGVRQRSSDYRRDGDGRVYPRPALLVGRHDGGDGDLPRSEERRVGEGGRTGGGRRPWKKRRETREDENTRW